MKESSGGTRERGFKQPAEQLPPEVVNAEQAPKQRTRRRFLRELGSALVVGGALLTEKSNTGDAPAKFYAANYERTEVWGEQHARLMQIVQDLKAKYTAAIANYEPQLAKEWPGDRVPPEKAQRAAHLHTLVKTAKRILENLKSVEEHQANLELIGSAEYRKNLLLATTTLERYTASLREGKDEEIDNDEGIAEKVDYLYQNIAAARELRILLGVQVNFNESAIVAWPEEGTVGYSRELLKYPKVCIDRAGLTTIQFVNPMEFTQDLGEDSLLDRKLPEVAQSLREMRGDVMLNIGHTIYADVGAEPDVIHHKMLHMLDGVDDATNPFALIDDPANKAWRKLNKGAKIGYLHEKAVVGIAMAAVGDENAEGSYPDYPSPYSLNGVDEEQAEMWRLYMSSPRAALEQAALSPIFKQKLEFLTGYHLDEPVSSIWLGEHIVELQAEQASQLQVEFPEHASLFQILHAYKHSDERAQNAVLQLQKTMATNNALRDRVASIIGKPVHVLRTFKTPVSPAEYAQAGFTEQFGMAAWSAGGAAKEFTAEYLNKQLVQGESIDPVVVNPNPA
jgi:hypothetical protein